MLEAIQYEDGLPVKVQVLRIDQYPWHTHKDIQLIYVIEGEVELKMIYARYRLVKNNIHVIHNEDVHGFKGISKNNLVVVLSLNMDYFLEYYPDLDTQVFSTKVHEDVATYKKQMVIKTYIFSIISELHSRHKGYSERIAACSRQLISVLYQDFRGFRVNLEKRTFEHEVPHDMVQIDRISRVVGFIYQNYPYKMSLSAIAKQENINNYYLSHLFQRLVGDSFRNFVSMVRVEMSEFELLTTDTSISQISQNVGFSNAKYYVENFRQWFGCHPREYRQLYRNEILGRAAVAVHYLPFDSINDVIESYSETPVFKGTAGEVKAAEISFKKQHAYELRPQKRQISASELYSAYEPHQQCLFLLKNYMRLPHTPISPSIITDTGSCTEGIFTSNGMPKPLYHVYRFLEQQYNSVCQCDNWYMVTMQDKNAQILFFNEEPDRTLDFEFHFFQMPGAYRITEHRLCPEQSCIAFWKQLNFEDPLEPHSKHQIEAMSAPRISFETINSSGSFTWSVRLAPLEIAFAEITAV